MLRDVSTVRGLTRETLIALTTDIESRNSRRKFNARNTLPPEHPCAFQRPERYCGQTFHSEAGDSTVSACIALQVFLSVVN